MMSSGGGDEDAVLYSTLEPCAMCLGAVVFSGIRTVVYVADDVEGGVVGMFGRDCVYSGWVPDVRGGVLRGECEALKEQATFREGHDV